MIGSSSAGMPYIFYLVSFENEYIESRQTSIKIFYHDDLAYPFYVSHGIASLFGLQRHLPKQFSAEAETKDAFTITLFFAFLRSEGEMPHPEIFKLFEKFKFLTSELFA
jgi:hypothetical protein